MSIPNTEFWNDFIEMFRNENTLWEIKSDNYKSKIKRDQSWSKLTQKYKEIEPEADVNTVKKKINGMRNSYRRELAKIKRSVKSGMGEEEVYEPSLWYFKDLDFLRDHEAQRKSINTFDSENSGEDEISEERSKRKKSDAAEELMMLAAKRLKQPPDEYEKIVASWAVKFKKMDERQRIYADKFINEILFEGQMGTLHRTSMQLNTSSVSSTPQMFFPEYSSDNAIVESQQSDECCDDTNLSDVLAGYSPENIMNADESGLFYKALPSETLLCHPDGAHMDFKCPKDRLTLLFICNSTGSFKRVYAIGKAKMSSYFKRISPAVPYLSNTLAWMTSDLWCNILQSLDVEMQNENRNIILLVDNASCHKTPVLKNIKIQYIPPNADCIQPMEQGIVHTFKTHYRQIIIKKQLLAVKRDMSIVDFYKSISLWDGLHFIKRAWSLVQPETIENCFKKAGFTKTPDGDPFELFPTSEEYINCDYNLKCYEEMVETSIIEFIKEEEQTDEEDAETNKTPTLKEALDALNVLQRYCLHNNIDTTSLDKIEDEILKLSMKSFKQQVSVKDYALETMHLSAT